MHGIDYAYPEVVQDAGILRVTVVHWTSTMELTCTLTRGREF